MKFIFFTLAEIVLFFLIVSAGTLSFARHVYDENGIERFSVEKLNKIRPVLLLTVAIACFLAFFLLPYVTFR